MEYTDVLGNPMPRPLLVVADSARHIWLDPEPSEPGYLRVFLEDLDVFRAALVRLRFVDAFPLDAEPEGFPGGFPDPWAPRIELTEDDSGDFF